MFNYEVKFLTCDEALHLKNGDFKSYKYETKKRSDETIYDAGKRSFCERRDGWWRAPRPRQIRQLESKLRERGVLCCAWTSETLVSLVFTSGAIAYLTIKPETLDVTQVLFDRYCVGKLSNPNIMSVVLCKSHLLFAHTDRTATLVNFGKHSNTQPCRISDRDPHIQCIELGGGARRSERKITWCENSTGVRVLVWGATAVEPAPWSPALEDLANLHLYQFTGPHVTLIAYHQLENDTLSVELSIKSDNIIHIVEQITSHKNGVTLDWLRYEVPSTDDRITKLSSLRESITQASLPAPVRVVRRSACDGKILAACIDGSLHVIHNVAGLVHSARAGFIATDVRWADEVVLAIEEGGRLQCFDRALSLLNHHTKCLDFAAYFRDSRRLQILATTTIRGGPLVLVSFTGGPLALLRIMHPRILTSWIRSGRTNNAVSLLRTLDWEAHGPEGLWAINRIVCEALRSGLQGGAGETAAQAALGAYLAPLAPHGAAAARLAPAVHDLARKFFHQLLRRGRIEKAMSLAVDLADWDLFADARWAATNQRLQSLADEAAALATHYADQQETDCSDTCSQCSSHSYSETDDETSASSDVVRTKPPPLPRVPIPANAIPQTISANMKIQPISSNIKSQPIPAIMKSQPIPANMKPQPVPANTKPQPVHANMKSQPIPANMKSQPNPANMKPQTVPANTKPHHNTTIVHVPITQTEPTSTHSIRPNLHQYLERDNTIWNTAVREDTQVNGYDIKPILTQNSKWHSVDNVLSNYKPGKHTIHVNEGASKIPHDDRLTPAHFRHLLQTELREDVPNTLYRYQSSNNYLHSTLNAMNRPYRHDNDLPERNIRSGEKNKVKFSDTVTIAVVPESARAMPSPMRELADSLPLSPPHAYLAAFAPLPAPAPAPAPAAPPPGTTTDYVEV